MFAFLSNFFEKEGIDLYSALPLSDCRVQKSYLLEREQIQTGSVFLFAVPYYTAACDTPGRNISAYAVSRDYHLYFQELFSRLLPLLKSSFPTERFAGFSDHSPIDERDAAAKAGLGVPGDNGLLLTNAYSSYVFIGEIITTANLGKASGKIGECLHCGRCTKACPANDDYCLSALTQAKGLLTPDQIHLLKQSKSLWGCDICQEVCPYTLRAKENKTIYTKIPYFKEEVIPILTKSTLKSMDPVTFKKRAYAWRGKEVIQRNIDLAESNQKGDS